MKKKTKWIFIIVIGAIGIIWVSQAIRTSLTPAIGLIEIEGAITSAMPYLEAINEFEADDEIKGVVVRLDSPGGRVGPSQEIFDAIKRLGEKKPVVASMASIGASGAYYIACGADKIYALPGTITGSIGVILEFVDISEGLGRLGVKAESITGGELKDAGSPFRHMSEEERAYFKALSSDVHEQFIGAVLESRGLDDKRIRPFCDGRVLTGRQAFELGLIDKIGGFNAAVEDIKASSGIVGKPRIIRPKSEDGIWKDVNRLIGSCLPSSLRSGRGLIPGKWVRLEYSIQ